jgi:hypothetical protein
MLTGFKPQFYISTKLLRASLRIHNTPAMQQQKIPMIIPASRSLALYDIGLALFAQLLLIPDTLES